MRPARPLAPLLLLLALVLPLGACSGAHDAHAWATQVCRTLAPWRTEIGSLTSRTQQQMTTKTTPSQAKENLMTLFGGARDASERARAGVAGAGVPDVSGGKQIAAGFLGSLAGLRDAYGRARDGVGALATTPADGFYDHVGQVVDRLTKDYQASSLDTSNLTSPELKQAFDEVPECR
jgi:hypothetical protein